MMTNAFFDNVPWKQLRDIKNAKKIPFQHVDYGSYYTIILNDGSVVMSSKIYKTDPKNDDQVDWETNYMSDSNKDLSPRVSTDGVPYVRVTTKTVGLRLKLHGGEFNAPAGVTTKHQLKLTSNIELVGALFRTVGANFGDKVDMKVVDVDNILGYGAGVTLSQFAINVPGLIADRDAVFVESTTSDFIMAGLYLSIEYTNAGPNDVAVTYAYKYYS